MLLIFALSKSVVSIKFGIGLEAFASAIDEFTWFFINKFVIGFLAFFHLYYIY